MFASYLLVPLPCVAETALKQIMGAKADETFLLLPGAPFQHQFDRCLEIVVVELLRDAAEEAERVLTQLQAVQPGISVSSVQDRVLTVDPESKELLLNGLRKAGMPEN